MVSMIQGTRERGFRQVQETVFQHLHTAFETIRGQRGLKSPYLTVDNLRMPKAKIRKPAKSSVVSGMRTLGIEGNRKIRPRGRSAVGAIYEIDPEIMDSAVKVVRGIVIDRKGLDYSKLEPHEIAAGFIVMHARTRGIESLFGSVRLEPEKATILGSKFHSVLDNVIRMQEKIVLGMLPVQKP